MSAALDELVNRLAGRVWQLVSAKIASRVELEVARTQAELLEQAAAFRRGHGKIGEQVARRLETASERLVVELLNEGTELDGTADLQFSGANSDAADVASGRTSSESDAGKRPRGRPKKVPAGEGLSQLAPTRDVTVTTLDEVIDEERTAARDPAGADQVPDFPA